LRPEFLAAQSPVAVPVELLESQDGSRDFLGRQFAVAIGIQGGHQRKSYRLRRAARTAWGLRQDAEGQDGNYGH
jgi:hypothetical protein